MIREGRILHRTRIDQILPDPRIIPFHNPPQRYLHQVILVKTQIPVLDMLYLLIHDQCADDQHDGYGKLQYHKPLANKTGPAASHFHPL